MKILELGKFYPPYRGGMETLLKIWAEGFVRRGATVDCVVANDSASTLHEETHGVRIHRLASYGSLFSVSLCPAYPGSTRAHKADLWHAHFPNPLMDLACLRGDPKIPLVLTYHSDIVRQSSVMSLYRPLMQKLLARATRIVVATPLHIEHSPWLPAWREKCEVIPFGIDLQEFAKTPENMKRAEALRQTSGGKPILLNIGRLVGYKGQSKLIDAVRQLDVAVWIIGTGPLERDLKSQAARLGIADRVKFWGDVADNELPSFFQACDIFVLPSITANEAFGLVQVEAMACGKPVVSCSLKSGVPYVNQDGVTGLIVSPGDVDALATALQRLISDAALCKKLGDAGHARALAEFDEPVMLQRYWDCFERLLKHRSS